MDEEYIKKSDALKIIETANSMTSRLLEAMMKLCITMDHVAAADVRPVVLCRDCIYDDKCFAQSILKEMSRIPFDKNRFFCADGERRDGGADG